MTKNTLTRRVSTAISSASVSAMRCSPRCGDCVFYVSNFGRADDTPNTPVRDPNSPCSRMFAAWRLRAALRGSSPSGEAARFPDRRQALGDCDKLATNAHVPLRSSASCHALLEMNSIPPTTLGWKA
jgi:hypothetical protein